jgi:hypothetical protein
VTKQGKSVSRKGGNVDNTNTLQIHFTGAKIVPPGASAFDFAAFGFAAFVGAASRKAEISRTFH